MREKEQIFSITIPQGIAKTWPRLYRSHHSNDDLRPILHGPRKPRSSPTGNESSVCLWPLGSRSRENN